MACAPSPGGNAPALCHACWPGGMVPLCRSALLIQQEGFVTMRTLLQSVVSVPLWDKILNSFGVGVAVEQVPVLSCGQPGDSAALQVCLEHLQRPALLLEAACGCWQALGDVSLGTAAATTVTWGWLSSVGRAGAALSCRPSCPQRSGEEQSVPTRSCSRQNTGPCPLLHFWGKGEDKGSVALFLHLPKVYLQGFQFSALHLRCLSRSCLHLFCVLAHL